ncbi:MAG: methyltransferase family protein, partial [Thermoplasmata archaeon]
MSGTAAEPPEADLLRMIGGYRLSQALYVLTKLGIPDRLSRGPKTAEGLAREAGADPNRLFRLLHALVPLGVLGMDNEERFSLTPVSQLLVSDSPHSFAVVVTFAGEQSYRAWGELMHTVTTGETAFDHLYGMSHFDYLARTPSASETFHRLMARSSGAEGFPLERYPLDRHRLVVDVG